jgi:hypothetical protein
MNEMIERVKRSRLPYSVSGRNSAPGKLEEWFIDDDDNLPAGEFVAGPFASEDEAYDALETMNARAVIAAMREPTEAMMYAGWQRGVFGDGEGEEMGPIWRAMIDEALKDIA